MKQEHESKFLEAIEENRQKLFRICSIYSVDDEDTKDLFQEVLVNIWQSMQNFKGKSSINTWMYRIALNVCLRIKTKQHKTRSRTIKLDSISFTALRTSEKVEPNEKLIQLQKCIKTLNEGERAIIALYLEQIAYKEISEILGLTENHVAVKLKRIKSKLLNCINTLS